MGASKSKKIDDLIHILNIPQKDVILVRGYLEQLHGFHCTCWMCKSYGQSTALDPNVVDAISLELA